MKNLLLLLVFGLAGTSLTQRLPNTESSVDSAFRARREYTYRYETQISTGSEPVTRTFTGFKMTCRARVQFVTYSEVRVAFEEVSLFNFDQPVVQYEGEKNLNPDSQIPDQTDHEGKVIKEFLQLQFGFTYDKGHVAAIQLMDGETWWSANAKKGFIALFEMNLQKRFQLPKHVSIERKAPFDSDIYTVLEQSPEGECATVYSLRKKQNTNRWYVMKTRDFNNCVEKPVHMRAFGTDDIENNPWTVQTNIHYNIEARSQKKFIIQNVVAEEIMTFTPYTEKWTLKPESEYRTVINQTLFLIDNRMIPDSSQIPTVKQGKPSYPRPIKMCTPGQPSQIEIEETDKTPQMEHNKYDVYSAEKIIAVLRMIAEENYDLTGQRALEQVRAVSDMLRTSPKSILKNVWNKLWPRQKSPDPIDPIAAKVFRDILPTLGSEPAAEQIMDICRDEKELESNCTISFKFLAVKAPYSQKLVRKLMDMINKRESTWGWEMKKAAYLTLGSFGYKLMEYQRDSIDELNKAYALLFPLRKQNSRVLRNEVRGRLTSIKNQRRSVLTQSSQTGQRIVNTISKLIDRGTPADKLLGLKSLANTGIPQSSRELKKIIGNRNEHLMNRLMAILGFRRWNTDENARLEAIETIWDVLFDTRETHEIRNMAFVVLVHLKPNLPIWEKVAVSMNHEKDKDVSNFILGFMREISNSTYEPVWKKSWNFTEALKSAPINHDDVGHSLFKLFGKYFPEYKWGESLSVTGIRSMPRYEGWSASWDSFIYGQWSKTMEIGFNTAGMGQFMDKLIGPKGLLTNDRNILDLIKRIPRGISPHDMIQQIFNELKVQERSTGFPEGHFWLNVQGHELWYYDFSEMLQSIVTTGKVAMPIDTEALKNGIPFFSQAAGFIKNCKLTLPSTAGYPISAWDAVNFNLNIAGEWAFKTTPYLLEEQRQGRPPLNIELDLEMTPIQAWQWTFSMGLDGFFTKATHGAYFMIESDVPIKEKFSYDFTHHKYLWEHTFPKHDGPYLMHRSEPISQRWIITTSTKTPIVKVERTSSFDPVGERVKPIWLPYDMPCMGWQLIAEGQVPRSWDSWVFPLLGRGQVYYYLKPMDSAAEVITFRAQQVYDEKIPMPMSYARSYAETMTRPGENIDDEEYGDDIKVDKYGRPLPTNLDDIMAISQPMDLSKDTITMQQLIQLLQDKTGKTIPYGRREWNNGWVFTMDASMGDVTRKYELSWLISKIKAGEINKVIIYFHREPIQGWDDKTWEWLAETDIKYPDQVTRPLDVFSVDWQRQLIKDLQWYIQHKSAKLPNMLLNETILGVAQQNDMSLWYKTAPHRTLEALVPQHMYLMTNVTANKQIPKNWNDYWRDLIPLFDRMEQENKLNLDPYFVSREGMLLNKVEELITIQKRLKADFQDMMKTEEVLHSEIPVMQWLNMKQFIVWRDLYSVIMKDYRKGLIHHLPMLQSHLQTADENCKELLSLMERIMRTITPTEQQLDSEGKPVAVCRSDCPFDHDKQERPDSSSWFSNIPYYHNDEPSVNTQQQEQEQHTVAWVRNQLYKLALFQIDVINSLHKVIKTPEKVDEKMLMDLLNDVHTNMTAFDQVFKDNCLEDDEVLKGELLMLSVNNEFVVHLLDVIKDVRKVEIVSSSKSAKYPTWESLRFKLDGLDFAHTTAWLLAAKTERDALFPTMDSPWPDYWKQMQTVRRACIVVRRWFTSRVGTNMTALRNPQEADALVKEYIVEFNKQLTAVDGIIDNAVQTGANPPVFWLAKMMETIQWFNNLVQEPTAQLQAVTYDKRIDWWRSFDQMSADVYKTMSKMSPLFTTVVNSATNDEDFASIFDEVPVTSSYLSVQDVRGQAKQLKDQVVKFMRTDDVDPAVSQKIVEAAVDRLSLLQTQLKQEHPKIISAVESDSTTDYQKSVVTDILSQCMDEISNLIDIMKSVLKQSGSTLDNSSDLNEKLDDLSTDLASMQDDLNNKLIDSKSKQPKQQPGYYNDDDYSDDTNSNMFDEDIPGRFSGRSRQVAQAQQPLNSGDVLPTCIVGLVNVTWGPAQARTKKFLTEFWSMRSAEQVLRLFKELDSLYRTQALVTATNQQMQGSVFETEYKHVLEAINSFNHIHTITKFDKDDFGPWWRQQMTYAHEWLKAVYWPKYQSQEPIDVFQEPKDQWQTITDMSVVNKKWDFFVMTRDETSSFIDLKLHDWIAHTMPVKGHVSFEEEIKRQYFNIHGPPTCYVNREQIRTIDEVSFSLTSETDKCEHLLAMDCSAMKSFAITMVKANSSSLGHIIRIINDDKTIEVDPRYLAIQVKVNGEVLKLEDLKPVVYHDQTQYGSNDVTEIIEIDGMTLSVRLEKTGVAVIITGDSVKIEVSPLYKSRTCGLCSNFDMQSSWEWEGPLREVYTNPTAFAKSYVMHSEQCTHNKEVSGKHELPRMYQHAPPNHPDYFKGSKIYRDVIRDYRPKGGEPSFTFDEDEDKDEQEKQEDECKVLYKNDVKAWKGKTQYCFSKDRVAHCPFMCERVQSKKERIEYYCVDAKDPQIDNLREDARSDDGINWDDYSDLDKSVKKRNYRVPQQCQKE